MKRVILAKYGEIILKGLNRGHFESVLLKNIKAAVNPCGDFSYWYSQSTLYVTPKGDFPSDIDAAYEAIKRVFGVATVAIAAECEKDIDEIACTAISYFEDLLDTERVKTFKVETKRCDKKFPMKSPEISAEIGGRLLEKFPFLSVDVHNPDLTLYVEIRDNSAYVHKRGDKGAGGVPVGTSGRGMLLLSGGIDSPVAGWLMARRGLKLSACYFATPPYTSEQATDKVVRLSRLVSRWSGDIKLHVISLTEYQEQLAKNCPQEYFTILLRRAMMRAAEAVALKDGCGALITGESLGQVASQTMTSIAATQAAVNLPVFRPLIGLDKEDIVSYARKIGTFETSIEPFEDCCAMFSPKHPKLNPDMNDILNAEAKLDIEKLIADAIGGETIER